MEEMIYKMSTEGNVAIVTLTFGNVTMNENEELKKAFSALLDGGAKNIVLDLSSTPFISSVSIASLVYMLKRAKDAGGNLVLCGMKDRVKEVLVMTNLDKVFDIFEDKKAAVASFTKK
ncbi:MAG: STAS domain-containing protein [Candidatus Omnitrophota bacterium]